MKKQGKLIITKYKGLTFSLLFDNNNNVIQINCDGGSDEILGNVYIGKVSNIVTNINAAFIDYSYGKTGYFQMDENIEPLYVDPSRNPGPLRTGDEVLVQVSKEAVGNKEPVLTSDINFVGKYVVCSTKKTGLHFSNKIKWPELKEAIQSRYQKLNYENFGFIIRTNAMHTQIDSIFDEIDFFAHLWLATVGLRSLKPCFSLLYMSPKTYLTNIRDGYHNEIGRIITDNVSIYEEIKSYIDIYQPEDINKLQLYNNNVTPLHVLYNVYKEIEDALSEKVWLKSGGYLYIQPTEALVAIDVNSGKYVSRKDAQKEFLKINLEAAEEIARQIRLRNLSGIIIIDFINMDDEKNREVLLKFLQAHLSDDPIKSTVVEMTKLNLVEITRKKIRKPLYEFSVLK